MRHLASVMMQHRNHSNSLLMILGKGTGKSSSLDQYIMRGQTSGSTGQSVVCIAIVLSKRAWKAPHYSQTVSWINLRPETPLNWQTVIRGRLPWYFILMIRLTSVMEYNNGSEFTVPCSRNAISQSLIHQKSNKQSLSDWFWEWSWWMNLHTLIKHNREYIQIWHECMIICSKSYSSIKTSLLSNYSPHYSMGCNYLSMLCIPASDTCVLIWTVAFTLKLTQLCLILGEPPH